MVDVMKLTASNDKLNGLQNQQTTRGVAQMLSASRQLYDNGGCVPQNSVVLHFAYDTLNRFTWAKPTTQTHNFFPTIVSPFSMLIIHGTHHHVPFILIELKFWFFLFIIICLLNQSILYICFNFLFYPFLFQY